MIQKGSANDVSLHRETGQVLETDDNLDFGDCYAGLVAVSDQLLAATNTITLIWQAYSNFDIDSCDFSMFTGENVLGEQFLL